MKIAIDLTPLYGRKRTGVEMYAIDLYKALLTTGHEIVPIFHVENEIDNNPNAIIIKFTNRILLENIKLPYTIRKIQADVTMFPIFPPPIDLYINSPSQIVPVIHDVAFIEFYSTLKKTAKYYLTPKYKLALKSADYIVTISEDARNKIRKYSNLKILNWKENISTDFKLDKLCINSKLLERFALNKYNYYISVSTIEPRKNLKYLLNTIRQELETSQKKLVLVGRQGWGEDKELNMLFGELKDNIIFTGYISLDMMQTLYHYAYAFTLLSVEEGFGRTPLEAIACGCKRIIVSDIAVFHETLKESANYLPLDKEEVVRMTFLKNDWKKVQEDFSIPFDALEKNICFMASI